MDKPGSLRTLDPYPSFLREREGAGFSVQRFGLTVTQQVADVLKRGTPPWMMFVTHRIVAHQIPFLTWERPLIMRWAMEAVSVMK